MSKKDDQLVQLSNQLASLSAGATNLFAGPETKQGQYSNYLMDSAKGAIQAQAAYMQQKKMEEKKERTPWGKVAGTALGLALAIPTGGLSIPAGAMLGSTAGGVVDSAVNKDTAGMIDNALGLAGSFAGGDGGGVTDLLGSGEKSSPGDVATGLNGTTQTSSGAMSAANAATSLVDEVNKKKKRKWGEALNLAGLRLLEQERGN